MNTTQAKHTSRQVWRELNLAAAKAAIAFADSQDFKSTHLAYEVEQLRKNAMQTLLFPLRDYREASPVPAKFRPAGKILAESGWQEPWMHGHSITKEDCKSGVVVVL